MKKCDACGREAEDLTYVEYSDLEVCPACLRICFAYDKDGVLKPVYDLEIGH